MYNCYFNDKLVIIYKNVKQVKNLKISQIANITGIKKHTLNARIKSNFPDDQIKRNKGNQILVTPEQLKHIINSDELIRKKGKIIYIGNLKGGVGKTSISYLLISALCALGYKVCAIDLDIQANLTNQFITTDESKKVFYDVIEGTDTIQNVITKISDNLDIIPSSLKNGLIHKSLSMQKPRHHSSWFNNLCLDYLRHTYDIIIVDTPPSLGTINSVFCLCLKENDQIIVPVCPEDFSIMGVDMFLEDILEIRSSYQVPEDTNVSIIMNRFAQNQKNNLQMLIKMNEKYKEMLSEVVIKDSVKIKEFVNNKSSLGEIKNGKELYETINSLLKELKIIHSN